MKSYFSIFLGLLPRKRARATARHSLKVFDTRYS